MISTFYHNIDLSNGQRNVNQKVNKISFKLMMVMLSLSQIVFLIHLITFFVDVGPKLASNIQHSGLKR